MECTCLYCRAFFCRSQDVEDSDPAGAKVDQQSSADGSRALLAARAANKKATLILEHHKEEEASNDCPRMRITANIYSAYQ